jgi:hypothetical protein
VIILEKMEKIALRLKNSHSKKKLQKAGNVRDKAFLKFQEQDYGRAQTTLILPEYK